MRKCESCGKLYQENKDVFCPHCGAVAVKQCTHGSSFDSDRYNRGEAYQNGNNTYSQGVEPHIQREKYPYNRFEDTFGDAGNYSDETPRPTVFPDLTKLKPKVNQKGNPKIGIIVFIFILVFNVVLGSIGANEAFTDEVEDIWADVSVEEEYIGEISSVVKNANIEFVEEDRGFKTFEIIIENMYLSYDSADYRTEIKNQIIDGDVFVEMDVCVFSQTSVPETDFDDALENSYFISANEGGKAGRYQFTYEFDYDEIVYINCGVYMYLENGRTVNAELPFGAFSISENGTVTYYTSYASDETDWATIFTECSNEANVDGYSAYIGFDDEE